MIDLLPVITKLKVVSWNQVFSSHSMRAETKSHVRRMDHIFFLGLALDYCRWPIKSPNKKEVIALRYLLALGNIFAFSVLGKFSGVVVNDSSYKSNFLLGQLYYAYDGFLVHRKYLFVRIETLRWARPLDRKIVNLRCEHSMIVVAVTTFLFRFWCSLPPSLVPQERSR